VDVTEMCFRVSLVVVDKQ